MLTVRTMTDPEFAEWRRASEEGYAEIQVAAGVWPAAEALDRARAETATTLPDGRHTQDMLLLVGEDDGRLVGHLWIALHSPRGTPGTAFLFDIHVPEEHRGKGYGRALLTAAEDAARAHGRRTLALNVHGHNTAAIRLYESAGYSVMTQQMHKPL